MKKGFEMKRNVTAGIVLSLLFSGAALFGWQAEEVPAAPLQLEVSTDYEGATAVAILKWRDMSEDELGFEVLRSDNGGEYRVVGMVGASTVNYKDRIGKYITGAFTYKVRAFNQAGKSEESNASSVWF